VPAVTAPPNILFAEKDRPNLHERYYDIALPNAPLWLTPHFEARVRKQGCVTMNMQPSALFGFLRDGEYKNLHRLVHDGEITPGADFGIRIAVEAAMGYGEQSHELIYGALNIGNLGCRFYGPYCVVIKTSSIADRVTFIEQNSMSYYSLSFVGNTFAGLLPAGGMALRDDVHLLAVAKLAERLNHVRGYDLPAMCDAVAGYFDSIEAHIFGAVRVADIEEIRVPPELIVQHQYLSTRRNRSQDDDVWYRAHDKVLGAIEDRQIRVRVAAFEHIIAPLSGAVVTGRSLGVNDRTATERKLRAKDAAAHRQPAQLAVDGGDSRLAPSGLPRSSSGA